MAITYPVDVANTQWATYRVSTGEIVARRKPWPVADGSAIVGQDPDYVMLLHVDDALPAYDGRLYTMESTEGIDVESNTLHMTHSTVARDTQERIMVAKNEEMGQLDVHASLAREAVRTRLAVTAILFFLDGQDYPPKVQAMVDKYKDVGIKINANRDRLDEIIDAIENGEDPDLDSGWATVDP